MGEILILGHRGDRMNYNDNTIEGIASAFNKGADGVEIDVCYKQDVGVYLAHSPHDEVLKTYPNLEEVIEKFAGKGKLQIEIKQPDVDTVREISKLVKKYKVENFEITTQILPLFSCINDFFLSANIGLIVRDYLYNKSVSSQNIDNLLLDYLRLTKASSIWVVDETNKFWDKKRVNKFHSKGYKIGHHLTKSSRKIYQLVTSSGIDSVIVDDLSLLRLRDGSLP